MPISRGNPPNHRVLHGPRIVLPWSPNPRGKSDSKKVVSAEKVSTNGFFIAAVTFIYQGLRRGISSTKINSGAISICRKSAVPAARRDRLRNRYLTFLKITLARLRRLSLPRLRSNESHLHTLAEAIQAARATLETLKRSTNRLLSGDFPSKRPPHFERARLRFRKLS